MGLARSLEEGEIRMNLVKCPNGHFYDESRFNACPHCNGASTGNIAVTVPLTNSSSSDNVTTDFNASASLKPQGMSLQDAVNMTTGGAQTPVSVTTVGDDPQTVGYYKKDIGTEPVVGWLVCVEGPHFGEDFRLKTGRNFIGRASNMDVAIVKDNGVSRERHSIVLYDPRGNQYLVAPGESKELCYLNDEVVLMPKELHVNDMLSMGETKLMFIPCCGIAFNWDQIKKEAN